MGSVDFARHCVAVRQLSYQPKKDFNVNTELLVLENGEVHASTWDKEPRIGGFDVFAVVERRAPA